MEDEWAVVIVDGWIAARRERLNGPNEKCEQDRSFYNHFSLLGLIPGYNYFHY